MKHAVESGMLLSYQRADNLVGFYRCSFDNFKKFGGENLSNLSKMKCFVAKKL